MNAEDLIHSYGKAVEGLDVKYTKARFPDRWVAGVSSTFGYSGSRGILFSREQTPDVIMLGVYNTLSLALQRALMQVGDVVRDGKFTHYDDLWESTIYTVHVHDFRDLLEYWEKRGGVMLEQTGSPHTDSKGRKSGGVRRIK